MDITSKNVLATNLLIKKPKKEEQVLKSGLIIPESADEITSQGVVVVAGKGTARVEVPVSVGQTVMFPPRAVQRVHVDGEDYFVLPIQNVLLYW